MDKEREGDLATRSSPISTAAAKPYVGAQIGEADISNVTLRPHDERDALP